MKTIVLSRIFSPKPVQLYVYCTNVPNGEYRASLASFLMMMMMCNFFYLLLYDASCFFLTCYLPCKKQINKTLYSQLSYRSYTIICTFIHIMFYIHLWLQWKVFQIMHVSYYSHPCRLLALYNKTFLFIFFIRTLIMHLNLGYTLM